jgi:DNA-binding beta-propeller fold protein YncE
MIPGPSIITLGRARYLADQDWAKMPPSQELGLISQVAVDDAGRVIIVQRAAPAVLIFRPDGSLEHAWHHPQLTSVHGLCVAPDQTLFIVSFDAHQVLKFSFDGALLLELGGFNQPNWDRPFNHPTDVAVALDGEIFVTDGYGNARVHRFAADGAHIRSWGSLGRKPGQFTCPHGIWIDEPANRVIAVDRDNDRIQLFDRDGGFQGEWTGFRRPMDIWGAPDGTFYVVDQTPSLSVLDSAGRVLGRGRMFPTYSHGISGDTKGNLFVAAQGPSRVIRLSRQPDGNIAQQ